MNDEIWKRCQDLVDSGNGYLVNHLYVQERQDNLTDEQLNIIGDLTSLIHRATENKSNMKDLIEGVIYLSKQRAIKGVKP